LRPEREYILYLEDMLDSINRIMVYLEGYDFERLMNDQRTLDAVIRNFEVIGEAANNVPVFVKDRYPGVPWRQMYGLRNYVSHEYFGLDFRTLWEIYKSHLPENKSQIENIIKELRK
jgi:uncharacterized protein with HEPN domain